MTRLTCPAIPGEGLEDNLVRDRGNLLVLPTRFEERALEKVVRLLLGRLSRPPHHLAFEFKPHAVNHLGHKTELVSFQFACFEKLIEKDPAIAVVISITRNKARHPPGVFDGDLNKFTVAEKHVHPRVGFGSCGSRRIALGDDLCAAQQE